jgi:O-antigen ligase
MFWTERDITGEEYYDIVRYFLMLVCFILVTMSLAVDSNQFFVKLKFWLCLVATVAAIIFIMVFYTSHKFPIARVAGPFSYADNPNQAAMFFGFAGILCLYSALSSKHGWQKILYGCSYLVILGYMLLSQSRGPILAFIFCLILGFAFERHWKAIGLVIALSIGLLCFIEFGNIGVHSFFDRGFSNRVDIWLVTLKRISQVPLFGEGYFTDVSIQTPIYLETSPHNLLLLVMLKSGLLGGGLLMALIAAALVKSYKYFISSGNWIYLCIFVYFIFCMTFDSTHLLYKPTLGWLIFWLPISLIAAEEMRKTQTLKFKECEQ